MAARPTDVANKNNTGGPMNQRFLKAVCAPVAATMFLISGPLQANAAMVPTEQVVTAASQASIAADRDRINAFLDREDVRGQMQRMGVSPAEAKARIAALSDAEVGRLAGRMDQEIAGDSFLGTVVGIVVMVAVVLLITDLLGITDVYPIGPAR